MISKKDFIELEFTGKIKDTGQVFDTTVKEDAKKAGIDETLGNKVSGAPKTPENQGFSVSRKSGGFSRTREFSSEKCKPLKICVGEGMILKGFDEALEGKEEGKKYEIELDPEKAFGSRNPSLVKIVPRNVFEHEPRAGMLFSFDGALGKVISTSSGRVTVDFNNPLAGKTISYSFKILRKITDKSEKLAVLAHFLLDIENAKIDAENKVTVPAKMPKEAAEMLEKKAKELISAEIKVEKK